MPTDPTLELERALFAGGAKYVIGVDEVGRGAVAGPVMVGVALLATADDDFPSGLRDSKLLSARARDRLMEPVERWVTSLAVGEASAREIDDHGIISALARSAERAFASLAIDGVDVSGATVILDGTHNWLSGALIPEVTVRVQPKADRDCAVVAAASVWAKVTRDRVMTDLGGVDDPYLWASNKGYGSETHMSAIREHGATDSHRRTWLGSVLA